MNDPLKSKQDARARQPLPSHVPHTVAKRFRVLSLLGSGAVGDVTEAYDLQQRRLVALKILRRDKIRNSTTLDRFFREAEMLGRVEHPGVVQVYASGTDEQGTHYLAMELIKGRSLREEIDHRGRMPAYTAARLVMEVCEVLRVAHELNVVHRDLKPGNLLLPDGWTEGAATVKIVDFGVAKVFGNAREFKQLTITGQPVGTPQYMAPEQVAGLAVDGRADLYALGCIFYYAITGHPPIDGPNPFAVYVAQVERAPVRIELLIGEQAVTRPLADVIHGLLAKKPEGRPPTATHLAHQIHPLLQTLPTTPRPGEVLSPDDYALRHGLRRTLRPNEQKAPPPQTTLAEPGSVPTADDDLEDSPTTLYRALPDTPSPAQGTPSPHQGTPTPAPRAPASDLMPSRSATPAPGVPALPSDPSGPVIAGAPSGPERAVDPSGPTRAPSGPHSGPSEGLDAIPATRSGPTQVSDNRLASVPSMDEYKTLSGQQPVRGKAAASPSRLKGLALGAGLGLIILALLAGALLGTAHVMGVSPLELIRGESSKPDKKKKKKSSREDDAPADREATAEAASDPVAPEEEDAPDAAGPAPDAEPAASRDASGEADAAQVAAGEAVTKGMVRLTSTPPGAEVHRGAVRLGETPLEVAVEVSEGRPAVFLLRQDGRRVHQVVVRPEELRPNFAAEVSLKRVGRREEAAIEVSSRPEGAEVSEEGRFLGLTPLVMRRPMSDQLYRLLLVGERAKREITVAALFPTQQIEVDLSTRADPVAVPVLSAGGRPKPR